MSTSIFAISGSALTAQSQRMNVAASNLANANSVSDPNGEPFKAKSVHFQSLDRTDSGVGGVGVSGVEDASTPMKKEYRPDHPMADDKGYVEMPNVNPTEQMVNMMSASRSYEANLNVLNTSKDLALRTLSLGE